MKETMMVRSEADERYKRCVLELERFGDRLSASPREHAAAEYLVEQLRAAGLEVEKQAFRGASSHGARFLVHVLLACAGIAAGWRWPLAGAALAAAALASLVAEQMTYGVWLSRLVCRSRSYNVVGRLRPSGRPVRRVIVSAHYDTQRRGWIWAPARVLVPLQARLPPTLMQPFLLLNLLMLLQVAAGCSQLSCRGWLRCGTPSSSCGAVTAFSSSCSASGPSHPPSRAGRTTAAALPPPSKLPRRGRSSRLLNPSSSSCC
jgi:hypothetical protein